MSFGRSNHMRSARCRSKAIRIRRRRGQTLWLRSGALLCPASSQAPATLQQPASLPALKNTTSANSQNRTFLKSSNTSPVDNLYYVKYKTALRRNKHRSRGGHKKLSAMGLIRLPPPLPANTSTPRDNPFEKPNAPASSKTRGCSPWCWNCLGQPNVKLNTCTPGSRNSISNVRSSTGPC
jgi:hypothetical protein